jgi:cell fate regulator YaaT (PSP1 superfamily)
VDAPSTIASGAPRRNARLIRLPVVSEHAGAAAGERSASAIPSDRDLPAELLFELELPDEPPPSRDETLVLAATVRHGDGRIVDHDAGDTLYARGDRVLCEAEAGLALGTVVVASRRMLDARRLPRIVRRANDGDTAAEARLRAREQVLFRSACDAVRALGLDAKVVRAEAVASGQRFLVYLAAEERLPYRDIVRALAQRSRERIEVRPLGARDTARLVGGVGPCGLQLCCNTFLSDFAPVSIRMAKDQGLALNPQKVSGVCGRLLCCLVYEEAYYRAQRKLVPKPGAIVQTPAGPARVREVDVLAMQARVTLESGEPATFAVAELHSTALREA